MSFNNNLDLINKLADSMPKGRQLIVFYTRTQLHQNIIISLNRKGVRVIPFKNDLRFVFKTLPILLTAKIIFCDNYYPFLGGLVLPSKVQVIQIWHADGAIKQFGWGDPKTSQRSKSAQRRFQQVYDCYDQFVVASKLMGQVFIDDYRVPESKIKLLGYPRSDRFFDQLWLFKSRQQIYRRFPEFKTHRVILYAPTYREGVKFSPPESLSKALTSDHNAIVIVKLHPALRNKFKAIKREIGSSSRLWYLNSIPTDKLLTVTNTLVTDYSSVAFDFSLLSNAHSMIFFTFDLKEYQKVPGCQHEFMTWLPSHAVLNVEDLSRVIVQNQKTNFKKFNLRWNTYNDGHASERFIKYYLAPLKRRN